jgi:hypothetical protein
MLYSFYLKKLALLDVFVLSSFYSVRILAGALISATPLSQWFLAFSMFFFLSLAMAKRYSELLHASNLVKAGNSGRGYHTGDRELLLSLWRRQQLFRRRHLQPLCSQSRTYACSTLRRNSHSALPHCSLLAQPNLAASASRRIKRRPGHSGHTRPCKLRSRAGFGGGYRRQHGTHEMVGDQKALALKLVRLFSGLTYVQSIRHELAQATQLPLIPHANSVMGMLPEDRALTRPQASMERSGSQTFFKPQHPAPCFPMAWAAVTATPASTPDVN